MSTKLKINVFYSLKTYTFELDNEQTITDLLNQLLNEVEEKDADCENFKFILNGKVLKPDDKLNALPLKSEKDKIFVVNVKKTMAKQPKKEAKTGYTVNMGQSSGPSVSPNANVTNLGAGSGGMGQPGQQHSSFGYQPQGQNSPMGMGMGPMGNFQDTHNILKQVLDNPNMLESLLQAQGINNEHTRNMYRNMLIEMKNNPAYFNEVMRSMQNMQGPMMQNMTMPGQNMGMPGQNMGMPGQNMQPGYGFNYAQVQPCSHGYYPYGYQGSTPNMGSPMQSNVDYEELFKTQLAALNEMGFNNKELNVRVLKESNGNVEVAIDKLFKILDGNEDAMGKK